MCQRTRSFVRVRSLDRAFVRSRLNENGGKQTRKRAFVDTFGSYLHITLTILGFFQFHLTVLIVYTLKMSHYCMQ